jgi:hypothetical protein
MRWLVTVEMADLDDAQVRGNLLEILQAGEVWSDVKAENGTTVIIPIESTGAVSALMTAISHLNWSFGVLQMPFPSVTAISVDISL